MNIISDRGANFVKAFGIYNPLYCFGHRLNNVLKICFFQQKKKKKNQNNRSSIYSNSAAVIQKNSNIPVVTTENLLNVSESESSESEEENQDFDVIDEDTLIKYQKKSRTTTAQQVSVDDIPVEAKKIILLLQQTKALVKYIKHVSV